MKQTQGPGAGVGLRGVHLDEVLRGEGPRVDWFEVITENYLGGVSGTGQRSVERLARVRRDYPLALHGVCLSLGSADPLDARHVTNLKQLADRLEPLWVSDHMCWTALGGEHDHDLLPMPRTEESLRHFAARVIEAQDRLGRRLLIENVSSYLEFRANELAEWEFLAELTRRTGCGLLLDVNNVYVNAVNHGFAGTDFLRGLPEAAVAQFHLAGHFEGEDVLIDTHDAAVPETVWALYDEAVRRFGPQGTIVEWDASIPTFEVLAGEADRARRVLQAVERSSVDASLAP
jgi:uncharacterized protein (UPF0276 family)